MRLTPTELDRLTIFTAAELARRRLAKGWRLNHPEALAIICDEMHEAARGGATYDEVIATAYGALTAEQVLDGVPDLLGTLRLECLFGDGTRVLFIERPIGSAPATAAGGVQPGEIFFGDGPIVLNDGRETIDVEVENSSRHTVFISSHYPFFEVNRRLVFDRAKAWGMRLDLPAGDAERWTPGEVKRVRLVAFGGRRLVHGFNRLTDGPATRERLLEGLRRAGERGYRHRPGQSAHGR